MTIESEAAKSGKMGHGMKKSGKLSGMKRHSGGKLKLGKGLGKR